jgi:hypothetical protein
VVGEDTRNPLTDQAIVEILQQAGVLIARRTVAKYRDQLGVLPARMRKRVVDELTTTFKSHYSHQISLEEALDPSVLAAFNAKRTGEKYLIRP